MHVFLFVNNIVIHCQEKKQIKSKRLLINFTNALQFGVIFLASKLPTTSKYNSEPFIKVNDKNVLLR